MSFTAKPVEQAAAKPVEQPAAKPVDQAETNTAEAKVVDASLPGTSTASCSSSAVSANWCNEYKVPWHKMSRTFMDTLKKEVRPMPSQKKEMVRIIIQDVTRICPAPKKKHLEPIAKQIVMAYPKAFKDTICGKLLGSGHYSILKSLNDRAQNVGRGPAKSKADDTVVHVDENMPKKRPATGKDSYGCIIDKYDPIMPASKEEIDDMMKKKEEMKEAFKRGLKDDATCKENMKATYVAQRRDILNQESVAELKIEWPFLFEMEGINTHFEELVGINLQETLEDNYNTKGKQVFEYLKVECSKKGVLSVCRSIAEAKGKLGNDTPDIPGLLLLVINYFSDRMEEIFLVVEVSVTIILQSDLI